MLEIKVDELQEVYQKGLAASTLITQPFWKDLQAYMGQQVNDALHAIEDAEFADDYTKARRVDKFILAKKLVARIEQFPLAAIEAARESGERE